MGSFANASFVGANTVNGPGPFSVSTSPAAFTAATRVVWSAELIALSTMSLVGYMAAPPTIGSCFIVIESCFIDMESCGAATVEIPTRTNAQSAIRNRDFISFFPSFLRLNQHLQYDGGMDLDVRSCGFFPGGFDGGHAPSRVPTVAFRRGVCMMV